MARFELQWQKRCLFFQHCEGIWIWSCEISVQSKSRWIKSRILPKCRVTGEKRRGKE